MDDTTDFEGDNQGVSPQQRSLHHTAAPAPPPPSGSSQHTLDITIDDILRMERKLDTVLMRHNELEMKLEQKLDTVLMRQNELEAKMDSLMSAIHVRHY